MGVGWRELLLLMPLGCGCGLFEGDPGDELPPDIAGWYEIETYRQGTDCENPGDVLDPAPAAFLRLEVAGDRTVRVIPCEAEDACSAELLHGAYYQGAGVWRATSLKGTTPSTGKCRLTFAEVEIVADGPDIAVDYVEHSELTDFVPILNPCKSDEASDELPCVSHLQIQATLLE